MGVLGENLPLSKNQKGVSQNNRPRKYKSEDRGGVMGSMLHFERHRLVAKTRERGMWLILCAD